MTVRELIEALGAFDPDQKVIVWDAYDDAERAPNPRLVDGHPTPTVEL